MTIEKVTPWVGFICIVIFLVQAVLSVREDSPTFDENLNPAVGYAELFVRDYHLYHDHPPLARVVTALPLLAFQPNVPFDHDSWRKKAKILQDRYNFAHEFFYVANSNADTMLFWSRVPIILLSLVLGLLIFNWARTLFGPLSGIFAIVLYTFEPNMLSHSRFATTDLIQTLFIFATVFQYWQFRQSPSSRSLLITGVCFGLALLSKFSAMILLPILFALAFLVPSAGGKDKDADWPWTWRSWVSREQLWVNFKSVSLITVTAVGVVFAFYGDQWNLYVKGFVDTMGHMEKGHNAYLMGQHSTNGWWLYFPIAFALKTPIALMALTVISIAFQSYRKKDAALFLWLPAVVIFLVALLSHINIGIRHVLPIYPFLIVIASSVTIIKFTKPRVFNACFVGLGIWYVVSTVSFFPSYLAYFNEFIRARNGYHYLVDSNLDWGQDLKRLKRFMDENKIERAYLGYFGTADPCYYGIHSIDLPGPPSRCNKGQKNVSADHIAISVTHLQSVYFADKSSFAWLRSYEPVGRIGNSIHVYDINGDAAARGNLAVLYFKYGMVKDALRESRNAVDLAPQDPMSYASLGFVYLRLSQFEKARAAFRTALQLDGNNKAAMAGFHRAERRLRDSRGL